MKVKTSYTSFYNFRPNECFGMGKESLIVSHPCMELSEFLEKLQYNSQLKHQDAIAYIGEEKIHVPEWENFIGQPMFFIFDIKIEPIT